MGATEERIAEFIIETEYGHIPPEAVHSARLGCVDVIGVMFAGAASEPGQIMAQFIREAGGTPDATVVGTGLRTTPVLAALANGALAHGLDYDDCGGIWGHPSCVLLPPLISLGERIHASGEEIVAAYAIGFEVASAIASGCDYKQVDRGFHTTSMYGTMAATAACARLLRLSREQTIMALGAAGSMPSGIVQNFGTFTKGLHAGLASHNGVMASLLAQKGWKGTDRVFESDLGFLSTYIGKDMYSLATICDRLGRWHLKNKVIIKRYPCCRNNHNPIDSLLAMLQENDIAFDDILQVDVDGMPANSHILRYPEPAYGFQGKFSLQYNLATALIDRRVDVASYDDEKLNRPQFRQALDKVKVHILPSWDPNFKPIPAENPVTITLKDGRTFRKSTNRHTSHGTPADPLTEEELFAKFKANAALISLPDDKITKAYQLWRNLDKMTNIGEGLKAAAGKAATVK
jgi:2-methylcitrate dehydratase PrpD